MLNKHNLLFYFLLAVISAPISCTGDNKSSDARGGAAVTSGKKTEAKPAATFSDTLFASAPAAVFYEPDSIQRQKIETATEKGVYESLMHEHAYQTKNAKKFLEQHWPALKIVQAKNVRYIVFRSQAAHSAHIIDLDSHNDAYGMLIFDGTQFPLLVDMTNIETVVPQYFSQSQKSLPEQNHLLR